jgi:hypothetical protein
MILKLVVAAALILHGLAHLSGFVAAFTSRDAGFSPKPWLLSSGAASGRGAMP